jgi:hypothetical protein
MESPTTATTASSTAGTGADAPDDVRLSSMFQFVEMNDDEITRIVEKNGVNTFQSLKDKRGDLQAGKLRHIS